MQTMLSPAHPQFGRYSFDELQDRIRYRAYFIYQERGREENHALEHWLQAKAEILGIVDSPVVDSQSLP